MFRYLAILCLFPAFAHADFSCDQTFPPGDWRITYCDNEDMRGKLDFLKEQLRSDLAFKKNWRIEFEGEAQYVDEYLTLLEDFESAMNEYSSSYCRLYLFTGGRWGGSGESDAWRSCDAWMLAETLARYESLLGQWPYGTQPGFDCDKAQLEVEQKICRNDKLSSRDRALTGVYARVLSAAEDRETLVEAQRRWLEETRNQCEDDDCLYNAYTERTRVLAEMLQE